MPARRKPDRAAAWAAAVLALALIAWILWPAASPPPAGPPSRPAPVAKVTTPSGPRKIAARRPPPPTAPAQSSVDEARVRAAVLARAASLRACAVPAGAPSQVPVRLRVPTSGEVRSVQLGGPEPLPAALAGCLREKLLLWRFDDLHLSVDVDLFATFALR
ncbi:MAG: hypothetical protein ACJ79H_05315 [Myxococcales bacterium]